MKVHSDLPKFIVSPLTGDILEKMNEKFPNYEYLSVANFADDVGECYDPYIVMYLNKETDEYLYIPYVNLHDKL